MRSLHAEKLTPDAFERFGNVIEATSSAAPISINSGTCLKFPNLAIPECSLDGGRASIHIYRSTPLPHPITVRAFERHNWGTQAFIPIGGKPYLIVVAPPGEFEIANVRVFRAEGTQGVQYHRGTWHHFCLALEAESEFIVIDRLSEHPDCDELDLDPSDQLTIMA